MAMFPEMELKGVIEMKDSKCRVFVLENKDQDKARQSFGIELSKRTYLLQAGDRKQMSKWVDFLSKRLLTCANAMLQPRLPLPPLTDSLSHCLSD